MGMKPRVTHATPERLEEIQKNTTQYTVPTISPRQQSSAPFVETVCSFPRKVDSDRSGAATRMLSQCANAHLKRNQPVSSVDSNATDEYAAI